jgi:5-hydroxytryptamine receptor 2
MTSIEHFHSDFLDNDHYENLSLITNLTTDLFTSDTNELNWPILILSILAVTGTLGNLLVCVSISLDKQLQTVTNWFLFSLAIADCLVSLLVLPLSIIKDFQGKNVFS